MKNKEPLPFPSSMYNSVSGGDIMFIDLHPMSALTEAGHHVFSIRMEFRRVEYF